MDAGLLIKPNYIESIHFDIFYKILEYLDSHSIRRLLLSSKSFYNHNDQIRYLLIKKIINNFDILKDDFFDIYIQAPPSFILYKFLNNLDTNYRGNVRLINILIHYIHFDIKPAEYLLDNKESPNTIETRDDFIYLFEFFIKKYHNNIYGNEQYYLSKYVIAHLIDYCSLKELDSMIKIIKIPYESITLYFDYINPHFNINCDKINKLFNYLCWKYFFGTPITEIDSHNILLCRLIKMYENKLFYGSSTDDIISITNNILAKQTLYKFTFNYQMLFNACITYNSEYYLDLILNNLDKINTERVNKSLNKFFITVTYHNIGFLVKNKFFNLLKKIVDIILGSLINLNTYIQEISQSIQDFSDVDIFKLKTSLLPYLTDYNKQLLFK